MARNRALVNILGVILGIASGIGVLYLAQLFIEGEMMLLAVVIAFLVIGLVIGFWVHAKDTMKIILFLGLFTLIAGITVGLLMVLGGFEIMGAVSNPLEAIVGTIVAVIIIVFGVIMAIITVVSTLIMIIGALIGRAIGQSIWEDNLSESSKYKKMNYS